MNHPSSEPDPPKTEGDPLALAQHIGWMRNLARALVRDTSTADDLAQDALVAALQPATGRPVDTRSWLATILRNRARDAERRREARERRERDAARPDHSGDFDELERRVEVGAEIARRVLALDEPLRSTLMLRFWDDLPPREIAKRQGIPIATVKSRLARGLDRLRRDLDASRGGDRGAWFMVVLPLAQKSSLIAAAPAAGWITMNSKLVATCAAACVLGSSLIFLRASDALDGAGPSADGSTASIGRRSSSGLVSDDGSSKPKAEARRGAGRSEIGPTAEREDQQVLQEMVVKVVDTEGRPVAGVDIRIASEESVGRTDRLGRVAITTGVNAGEVVAADADEWVTVRPGSWRADRPSVLPLVIVARALSIEGCAVDEFGFAVRGAAIDLRLPADFFVRFDESLGASTRREWSTTADSDGRFALQGAPGIAGATLVATREGYAGAEAELPSTDRSDLALVLFRPRAPEATALRGRVLRANGAPASEARVTLGHELVAADHEGMFELDLALAGDAEKIVAIEAGALAGEVDRSEDPVGPRRGWPRYVEITLGKPPLTIAGTVVDEEGKALAGARLWLDDPTGFGTLGLFPLRREALAAGLAPSLEAVSSRASVGALGGNEQHGTATPVGDPDAMLQWVETDGDGRFTLRGLEDRAYTLNVVGPNLEYLGRSGSIAAGTDDARIQIATGERYAELRGHVVTRLGEPVPGVFITPWIPPVAEDLVVRDGTASVTRFFFTQGTRSDEQGAFVLTNVPKQYLQFFLGGNGVVPAYGSVDDVTDPLDFDLVVRARVEVSLELVDTGRGIDRVTAVDASGAPVQALRMFADGHSTLGAVDVVAGRTGVFSLTTDADRLQLFVGDVLIDEIALRLVPGEVARLEW